MTFHLSFLEHLTLNPSFYKAHASVPLPLYHCARLPSIPSGLNFEDWISNQRVSSSICARSELAETYMSSFFPKDNLLHNDGSSRTRLTHHSSIQSLK
jgi:hypothetical protein